MTVPDNPKSKNLVQKQVCPVRFNNFEAEFLKICVFFRVRQRQPVNTRVVRKVKNVLPYKDIY